jgi:hypothetical protein
MLRDFARFLFAVWNEWKVLLTGGTLIALLFIVGALRNKPMPPNVNWLVLGLTLVAAAFLAWRREWIENGKGFVDITPEQLTNLVDSVTRIAAQSSLKPYRNKWIKVTGRIQEVSHLIFPYMFVRLLRGERPGIGVNLNLPRWRAKSFIPLPRGTTVTVVGRIAEVGSYEIRLTNAELISVGAPPASTPDQQSPPASQA